MRAEVIPATQEHAQYLATRLRQADIDEMWAAHGVAPEEGLRRSLALSTQSWTGMLDGEPVCLFGVGMYSVLTGKGMPWFVASEQIERNQITFLRRCRHAVAKMLALYPCLMNWVDARNTKAIEWLQWLGFTLQPAKPFGYLQLPFHKFELRA